MQGQCVGASSAQYACAAAAPSYVTHVHMCTCMFICVSIPCTVPLYARLTPHPSSPCLPMPARGCFAAGVGVGYAVSKTGLLVVQHHAPQRPPTGLRTRRPPQLAAAEVCRTRPTGTPAANHSRWGWRVGLLLRKVGGGVTREEVQCRTHVWQSTQSKARRAVCASMRPLTCGAAGAPAGSRQGFIHTLVAQAFAKHLVTQLQRLQAL